MKQDNPKDWKKIKEEYESNLPDEPNSNDNDEIALKAQEDNQVLDDVEASLSAYNHKELEEKLALAEQKAQQYWDKSVRALAELENVRRGAERDITKAHRYALDKFISELLPVLDSIEQALQIAEKTEQLAMIEGLEFTMKLFLDALEKHQVMQLNPLEELFNPQEHEAMAMQDAPDAKPNTVVAVFQKGYKLHDRIVRPARVIVAKTKNPE